MINNVELKGGRGKTEKNHGAECQGAFLKGLLKSEEFQGMFSLFVEDVKGTDIKERTF